jgi:lysophospholipase L1-like esterase
MDGGGNDILIPAMLFDPNKCKTKWYRPNLSSRCKGLIEDIYVTSVNLLNQMDADGVENVVYLGYYELPRGNTNLNQAVNYGDTWLGYACDVTTANCAFVDPRGHVPAEDVESDDIHPTPTGSVTLANLIWPVLEPLL